MGVNKPKQALGENPLSKSIFTPTSNVAASEGENQESRKKKEDSLIKKEESRFKNLETPSDHEFLAESSREKVNFRLPIALNDWLDDLIKSGKRKHGQKIPKEIWVQAALELMRELPIDWSEMASVDELRAELVAVLERVSGSE